MYIEVFKIKQKLGLHGLHLASNNIYTEVQNKIHSNRLNMHGLHLTGNEKSQVGKAKCHTNKKKMKNKKNRSRLVGVH